MFLGYNTNGLAYHDPFDAVALLAENGFRGVAITIDHGMLNPYGDRPDEAVERMRRLLDRHNMRSVVETGARFLLDPRQKHEPTLMTADPAGRAKRVEFLCHAIDIAAELGSDCVSLWSGVLHDDEPGKGASEEEAFSRLVAGLEEVLQYATARNVTLGFEPEPGMVIDNMQRFEQLQRRIDSPQFLLTLDVGHLHCQGEVPIADQIRRWHSQLVNIHIEDMRAGIHQHLMFGEGEIDFRPIIETLIDVGYKGGLFVELSRHSHEGIDAALKAYKFLSRMMH